MIDATNASDPPLRERLRAARALAARARRGGPLVAWSGWGFVLCGAIAVGHGLWALYGSGARVAILDLPASGAITAPPGVGLGPIRLAPEMNPLRGVVRASYAPVGSTRIRYEIAVEDAAGARMLVKHGAFGSRDDEASRVTTKASLGDFRVASSGEFFVRARLEGGSMDALREATIELRRNVTPVDARIPWVFGSGAVACLIVNLVATRRRGWYQAPAEDETRAAA